MRAKVTKTEKNTDAAAEQRRAVAREMWALEGEIGSLRVAIAPSRAQLKENLASIAPGANHNLRRSQEREAREERRHASHQEQLGVLRFQGEDCASTPCNPHK
jgi:septal ring factor EnvC (AmiA/AmiB activator)